MVIFMTASRPAHVFQVLFSHTSQKTSKFDFFLFFLYISIYLAPSKQTKIHHFFPGAFWMVFFSAIPPRSVGPFSIVEKVAGDFNQVKIPNVFFQRCENFNLATNQPFS